VERLYTQVSAAEVRRQLLPTKGYKEDELPTAETIRQRLNELGYSLKRVSKTKPKKSIPETEAIFKEIHKINQEADADRHTLGDSHQRHYPIYPLLPNAGDLGSDYLGSFFYGSHLTYF
jgi:hypothetical protein